MRLTETVFKAPAEAEAACAAFLVDQLARALDEAHEEAQDEARVEGRDDRPSGDVGFMVSGGSTPTRVLPVVAAAPLDWTRIVMFASDERIVALDDPASTEGMVRRIFGAAGREIRYAGAGGAAAPEAASAALCDGLSEAPAAKVALLGTAADGHVASLFPGRSEIDDPRPGVAIVPETPPHAHARLTMRLATLAAVEEIALVVAGPEKTAAYRRAVADAQAGRDGAPLARLFAAARGAVSVFLSP